MFKRIGMVVLVSGIVLDVILSDCVGQSNASSRARRKPRRSRSSMFCCDYENDFGRKVSRALINNSFECYMDHLRKEKDYNWLNLFQCEDPNKLKETVILNGRCVFQKMDLSSDDHEGFVPSKLKQYFRAILGPMSQSAKLAEDIVVDCINRIMQDKNYGTDEFKDFDISLRMIHCLWRDLTLACPEEKLVSSGRCDFIRAIFGDKTYESIDNVLADGVLLVHGFLFHT